MHAVVNGAAGRAGVLEGVEPFMIPAQQHRLSGFLQPGHHNLNIVRLADTIETADTLLQQIRVKRQVEHHQTAGELEVAPFGTDFGAEQHLRAVLFRGEPGGGAVAFDNR